MAQGGIKMNFKVGDKVRTRGFSFYETLVTSVRNGVTGIIESFDTEDDIVFALVVYDAGQEDLPNSAVYGKRAGEYLLTTLVINEPISLEPEQGFYVGQAVRLKGISGKEWAEDNNVTDGTKAIIKGFYTCDYCDERHIELDVDGRKVLGIGFDHIVPDNTNVA